MLAVSTGLGPGWVGGRCHGILLPLLWVSFSTDVLSGLCFHSSCLCESRGTRHSFGDPGWAPSQAAGCVGRAPGPSTGRNPLGRSQRSWGPAPPSTEPPSPPLSRGAGPGSPRAPWPRSRGRVHPAPSSGCLCLAGEAALRPTRGLLPPPPWSPHGGGQDGHPGPGSLVDGFPPGNGLIFNV